MNNADSKTESPGTDKPGTDNAAMHSPGQSAAWQRMASGSSVDTGKVVHFNYDGKQLRGVVGDTLASALLANGVRLVGRSFKYHRPRGIFTAGSEEPNALVQLEDGELTEPNTRATQVELYEGLSATSQNCWPSVNFDIGAINSLVARILPAGFYYKTFMWPASMWLTYEKFIRKAAGLGRSPVVNDPDQYEQLHAHCDVLIVGAGPAGLAATMAAARTGARVILMEEQPQVGGSLLWNQASIDGQPGMEWVKRSLSELEAMENVRLVTRCTVAGYYDYNFLTALERISDHLPVAQRSAGSLRQRFWKIRASKVVLCTGSIERPLLFADNDRPGVMLASSLRTYLHRYAVLVTNKLVVFTNNDSAYAVALEYQSAGAMVTLVDLRDDNELADNRFVQQAKDAGIVVHGGCGIVRVNGKKAIRSVVVGRLDAGKKGTSGPELTIDCDTVGCSGGWNPTVHLHSQARGKLQFEKSLQSFVPDQSADAAVAINPSFSAGACAGQFSLNQCLIEGFSAGSKAARLGLDSSGGPAVEQASMFGSTSEAVGEGIAKHADMLWTVPTDHPVGEGPRKHFHDLQNDVTVADIHLAAREGYLSVEHLKRYTTTGMGTDQGKTSNISALAVMAEIRGAQIPEVGTTTFRPPFTPVTLGAVAGQYTDDLFLQSRKTAIHDWHVENGAVFEDVGDWKRPWYFPRAGEDMHQAVQREVATVRKTGGMLDASTLGKIDLQGPDVAKFLEMIYTNAWSSLAVGKCRYGLMLNEHGMVFDDGVTTRLAENHYHMTTTTGGAARVLGWLEEWLQTEWPDWQVYCNSVTEQWAVIALNGPVARQVLQQCCDLDFSEQAFPHMSFQEGAIGNIPARIFRISFTGEMSFEINVPARYGRHVWELLYAAGQQFDLCTYGTEAMHVLRAEKGFIIVGQDTDGTVTPHDLGMSWIVSQKKHDFLGKRSLSRSDTAREARKQLVGLLTDNPETVLPEGSHLVSEILEAPPMQTEGHVTSSYMSPNLGRSIALAMIDNGLARLGESVTARLMDGQLIAAKIVEPVFFDSKGERMHD